MIEKNSLNTYIKWMIETYAEMRSAYANNITHRVVEYKKNKDGECEVFLQVIGKHMIFKSNPKEILGNDNMLEYFSKKDIRLLTYLACEHDKKPTNNIVGQKFIRSANKFSFKLKHALTGDEVEKFAEEISSNPDIIKTLHAEDAHKIGFVTANEQFKMEKEIKK